ncbi:uncharacterized protein N7459_009785 [Penicillium hispanicum]|uniref:uncharacterized protein n=1 Tax=Penicillium hispanicum TaxID=1080232 RepID=UPI0025404478|nr:uncharacterized protein N7459_009785 [Penicillium hispanicum]KAJ5570355.1 hypothetical protein N7459_009785 [Penicillium hispanicum]
MNPALVSSAPAGPSVPSASTQLAAFPPRHGVPEAHAPISRRPRALDYPMDPFMGYGFWDDSQGQHPTGNQALLTSSIASHHHRMSLSSRGAFDGELGTRSADRNVRMAFNSSPSPVQPRQLSNTYSSPPQAAGNSNTYLPPGHTSGQPGNTEDYLHDRWLLVEKVHIDTEILEVVQLFKVDTQPPQHRVPKLTYYKNFVTVDGPFLNDLNINGKFYVGFYDSREANFAMHLIASTHPDWEVVPVSREVFERESRSMIRSLPTHYDDQLVVSMYCGPSFEISRSDIVDAVKPILEVMGDIQYIHAESIDRSQGSRLFVHELIVRYFNSAHCLNAYKALNGVRTESFVLEVLPYCRLRTDSSPRRHWTAIMPRRDNQHARSPSMSPRHHFGLPTPERTRGVKTQNIDPERIKYRDDSRTTVMLKNIPNGMKWWDLKAILDQTSAGRYDCMYLRMDFDENQNVGYAFVNFVTPLDILPFLQAREGRTWPGFTRFKDKIAEVSYGNVQGKEGFIQQFRNSPVILDKPENRPKMFYVSGPRAGTEAPFPPVNNFHILAKGVIRSKKSGLYRGGAGVHRLTLDDGAETPVRNPRRDRDYDTPVRGTAAPYDPYSATRDTHRRSERSLLAE